MLFRSVVSLQLIKHSPFNEMRIDLMDIGEQVLKQLMLDNQIDEMQATDIFYNSETFAQLADESTKSYKRTWQEIYEMLKKELKM